MSMSDNISDMLTRIRNAQRSRLLGTFTYFSKIKSGILNILFREGYIGGYEHDKESNILIINLKYLNNSSPVIQEINRVSKPGRRVYVPIKKIGSYFNGFGVQILSTSKGIISDKEARKLNVGGEVLCKVF